ncbi:AraC family transcriptional regulator [Vibrio lentus]|nr:AraC family transcriptional regulator [Vibrio lentus]
MLVGILAGKVSDVAFDSGFNDPSYFSQRFKHHFGMSTL